METKDKLFAIIMWGLCSFSAFTFTYDAKYSVLFGMMVFNTIILMNLTQ